MFCSKLKLVKLLKKKIMTKWIFLVIFGIGVLLLCFYLNSVETQDDFENSDNINTISSEVNIIDSSQYYTRSNGRAANSTDPCLKCHVQTGTLEAITLDWENSKHAEGNVSCIDCHEAEESDPGAISHNGLYMSPVVSPKDCAECHPQEALEFEQSLHSLGGVYYEFLYNKKKLPFLESQVEGGYISADGEEITHAATIRGCQSCHGTNMTGTSTDDFTVWPNNGIGRINPDGSKGSCSACHTRHSFSIEEARKPETCGQCHMGPDHPQIEMFLESKHGNIYSAEGDTWNWSKEDWVAGVDYRAPTCAGCHMSAAPGVPATHDVSSRLSWELESEISRRTDNKANSLGIKFSDGSTWQEKQGRMKAVCKQCHSTTWVENYYEQADLVVKLYNEQYKEAKEIVTQLYEEGLLTSIGFDEPIEFKIYEMWHHEGRRARMAAFMQAPDYVQWHGFYDLLKDKVEIETMSDEIRSQALEKDRTGERSMVFLATDGHDNKIYLKWNISHPNEVDHYEIYWSTSLITDFNGLTPNAKTNDDFFVVDELSPDSTYYFTIVALDSSGNQTSIAFSSAMPTKLTGAGKTKDTTNTSLDDPVMIGVILIIIILIILLLISIKKR